MRRFFRRMGHFLPARMIPLVPVAVALLSGCASLNTRFYAASETGWAQTGPPQSDSIRYTMYMIGDAGKPTEDDPVLMALEENLKQADPQQSAVVFLGDNLYPNGLPPEYDPERRKAERYLDRQLEAVEDFEGRIAFLPGNHDWQKSGRDGWEQVRRQAEYVDDALDRDYDGFLPEDGCPGPRTVPLGEDALLVIFDSQWWLHPWGRPGKGSDCDAANEGELIGQMRDILQRNRHKKLFVAAHHPMFSYGHHGGRYSVREHLFPLTTLNDNFYLPLPGLGSIMPLYRGLIGHHQDIPHFRHQQLKDSLLALFAAHEHITYINGHEHNLQALQHDDDFFLVSGAGSKRLPVGRGRHSLFALARQGFLRLLITEDEAVWVEYLTPSAASATGEVVFRKKLYTKPYQAPEAARLPTKSPGAGQQRTVQASLQYQRGSFHRSLLGDNWRDVWDDTLQAPVVDLGSIYGGLRMKQIGGGQQTQSIRMEAPDGRQYNLRSVNKYAAGIVPAGMERTLAQEVVQDEISGTHPYGALAARTLSNRIGLPHTHPRLVVIPDDPRLGPYQQQFAGTLALLEARPDDEAWGEAAFFGKPPEIESTSKVVQETREDNDEKVDQQAVLRARLFDMWVGDWDRHADQWRWGEYEEDDYDLFKPIPRDRDEVFFHLEGPVNWLLARKWLLPKFQGFHEEIRHVGRFNHNARHFDRFFLTEPDRYDWRRMIDSLQRSFSDMSIERALREAWPEAVYASSGEAVRRKLIARRDRLSGYGMAYYRILAREVDLRGTDKHERFLLRWEGDTALTVTIRKTKKEGQMEHQLYQRRFRAGETREVRLYGLDGVDRFVLEGEGEPGIRVRIIGGAGSDFLTDRRQGDPPAGQLHYYDWKEDFLVDGPRRFRDRTSRHPEVNDYNRESFDYDRLAPAAFFGYNPDDGLFLGGGVTLKTHGFRKQPFASQQRLVANYAFRTRAYNFQYEGQFTDVLGRLDLAGRAVVNAPEYALNYYGLGNGTPIEAGRIDLLSTTRFYNTRFERYLAEWRIGQITRGPHRLSLGPFVEDYRIEAFPQALRESESPALRIDQDFPFLRGDGQAYWGGILQHQSDNLSEPIFPLRGVRWDNELVYGRSMSRPEEDYLSGESALSLYFTLPLPLRTTVALRGGGGFVDGAFPFFRARFLGGERNLRGYGQQRFAGTASAYQNSELRLKAGEVRSFLLRGDWGFHGFHDVGRVWYWEAKDEPRRWYNGYGGGLWLMPFNQFLVRAAYARGEEVDRIEVGSGFLF